jgi:hypothetical protein
MFISPRRSDLHSTPLACFQHKHFGPLWQYLDLQPVANRARDAARQFGFLRVVEDYTGREAA